MGQGQSQYCVGLSPEFGGQWHLGVLDLVLLKYLGVTQGQGVRGLSCHEHPILWELGSQPLVDWGICGYEEAKDSRTFWGLKCKSKEDRKRAI